MYDEPGPATSARVDFSISDNTSWLDAIMFTGLTGPCGQTGPTGVTGWQLTGTFQCDIRGDRNWGPTGPSLSLTSAGQPNSVIVVVDPINLIFYFNVSSGVLTGQTTNVGATGPGLVPGHYVYGFRMTQTPNVIELMHGTIKVKHGV